jgi:uncharacterized glyoxalase superfamily protein PhnB
MLGSVRDKAPQRHIKLPSELDCVQTRSVSLTVKDANQTYGRAKAAGAKILEDSKDKPFGGRGFSCLDPEGHIWHVGTYNPWAPK